MENTYQFISVFIFCLYLLKLIGLSTNFIAYIFSFHKSFDHTHIPYEDHFHRRLAGGPARPNTLVKCRCSKCTLSNEEDGFKLVTYRTQQ
jgi:hypothetical protein